MTYSETREMYTIFYAVGEMKKKERNGKLLNALKLLLFWFLPYSITAFYTVKGFNLSGVQCYVTSFVILALSFLFSLDALKRERVYTLLSLFCSILIAVSSALTVLL